MRAWLLLVGGLVACRAAEVQPVAVSAPVAVATTSAVPTAGTVTATPAFDVSAINQQFRDMKEVASFVKKFEAESREIFTQRLAIADAVGLRPGERIADIGAGTGLFEPFFSLAVGPAGKVTAIDIAPLFLAHIRQRALTESLPNVTTLLCDQQSTNLPPASSDVVFVCDVYHHFEHPDATLASIRAALVPGGRLIVVDFDRVVGKSSDFVLKHVRADKATFRAEIEAAGFVFEREVPLPLKENWFGVFRRP